MQSYPYFLAGQPIQEGPLLPVMSPGTGECLYQVFQAEEVTAAQAVQSAREAMALTRVLPAWKRAAVLTHISRRLQERREEIAGVICDEAGKPLQFARAEVDRAVQTFRLAAAWVWTRQDEVLDLSHAAGLEGRMGIVQSFPCGPCLLIAPFNFPLNLVAHKVAPAIATGNAFVLKPASPTPRTALILGEIIAETEYPAKAWSILPCSRKTGQFLVEHPGFNLLSFTGSPEVGWKMKADAGKKKVVLELGGDAAVILDETARLEEAIPKILTGAYAYAGQICISVQRIVATRPVYGKVREMLLQAIPSLPTGDAHNPMTVCGPMIDESNTRRTLEWIEEAQQAGASLLCGGVQTGHNLIQPALLENVPAGVKLREKEAFAPLALLMEAEDFEHAVAIVNDSPFGLQTGIFTHREDRLKWAFQNLEVGGVIHNQAPTLRIDAMPYGGIKDSGLGREGIAWACRDMLEPRILVW